MPLLEGLWQENTAAWEMHQRLCGRTVHEYQLESWLLERWTQGWSGDDVVDLLERLDVIAGVLNPHGSTEDRRSRQR